MAAKNGSSKSQGILAQEYSIQNDCENTHNYMKLSTNNGNSIITIHLYKQKHFKDAFNCFSYLSKINHPIAKYFIGLMKYKGQGCEKNLVESYSIMKYLSENGIDMASDFIDNFSTIG